jgi:hypothetical protein
MLCYVLLEEQKKKGRVPTVPRALFDVDTEAAQDVAKTTVLPKAFSNRSFLALAPKISTDISSVAVSVIVMAVPANWQTTP